MKSSQDTIANSSMLDFFLYFFVFFPFIKLPLLNMNTDMQPYVLIIALLYFGRVLKKAIPTPICVLGIFSIIIFSISLFINKGNSFYVFRSFYNYVELLTITLATHECIKKNSGINEYLIKTFILIWFLIAFIQMFISNSFMTSFVSNYRTSLNRGVCCINSEPSFYGYMCYFTLILVQKFKSQKFFYSLLLIIQIVLFAQSSVSIIYLLITFILLQLYNLYKFQNLRSLFNILLLLIIILFCICLISVYFIDSRMYLLLHSFIENPVSIFLNDVSIKERLLSITLSLRYFFVDFGFPHGFVLFKEYNHNRIMSGFGALLYEMGIIGLIYIVYIFKTIKSSFNVSYAFSIIIIMFSSIQLGLPIFGFLTGFALYESELYNYDNEVKNDFIYKKM